MYQSQTLKTIALALAVILLVSIAAYAGAEETLTYQGNKARITVGKIKTKADKCPWDLAEAIGEMLSTALANNERFIVLASQEEVAELAEEIEFGQSGYVEEGRGPDKGLMEGADILITGAVTAFEPDAGGSGGGFGALTKKAFGKVGLKTKKAEIRLDIKLIDIRTRRIIKAKSLKAKSTKWKTDMAGGGLVEDVALAGGLGIYSNQPMEDAIRAVLAKTVEMVSKEIPKEYYRYKGRGQYTQQYGSQQTPGAPAASPGSGSQATTGTAAAPAATAPTAEDMKLYTKYDFIPGDKVIFYDDLRNEEEGEFPYRWNLDNGVFEIVRLGKDYWIMCTDEGSIRPRIPDAPLPPKYTVEMEFYDNGPDVVGHGYSIAWVDAKGKNIGEFKLRYHTKTWLYIFNREKASKALPGKLTKGVHTMRIMATKRSIKCYVDQIRVANVPKVEGFNPVGFRVRLKPHQQPNNPLLIRNFRFAEGGKTMRQQLDETGKIVTHGILFDPGSYTIKAESYKTLKEIGRLLTDDPGLRLLIEGHTDSDGSEEQNMTLSQNRADAVRNYLLSTFGISADRLETRGRGESAPIDTNDTPEGKANNRRVELIKL
jgi:outer membrane protein OmpA-like peptidoglycan-associated protein/curli biogenesis system outer membrane secretion channel CsgG